LHFKNIAFIRYTTIIFALFDYFTPGSKKPINVSAYTIIFNHNVCTGNVQEFYACLSRSLDGSTAFYQPDMNGAGSKLLSSTLPADAK
jgi:hypothetical protein